MVEPAEKGRLVGYGRTADIFTWGDDQVLKLFHENWSVAAVEEEARIGRLVRDMGLPVPDVSGTVQDGGRFGVIYERVDYSETVPTELTETADLSQTQP